MSQFDGGPPADAPSQPPGNPADDPVEQVPDGAPVVGRAAYDSDDPMDTVYSLIEVVNSLYQGLLTPDEVGDALLVHYYLDYYVAQVDNGGHSQFLANSLGVDSARMLTLIQQGLDHLALPAASDIWSRFVATTTGLSAEDLDAFAEGYLDERGFHPLAQLEALDDPFYGGVGEELAEANARWLRSRPDLVVLDDADLPRYAASRAARVPDRAERERRAREHEPSFVKAARAWCQEQGLAFEQVTAGVPATVDGATVIDWAFLAEGRLFSLIELPDGTVRVTERTDPLDGGHD